MSWVPREVQARTSPSCRIINVQKRKYGVTFARNGRLRPSFYYYAETVKKQMTVSLGRSVGPSLCAAHLITRHRLIIAIDPRRSIDVMTRSRIHILCIPPPARAVMVRGRLYRIHREWSSVRCFAGRWPAIYWLDIAHKIYRIRVRHIMSVVVKS